MNPPEEFEFHVVYKKSLADLYSTGVNVKAFSYEGCLQKLREHTDVKEENILFIMNKTTMNK